jgi:DNA-binding CsgD family transcriptional regulator
MRNPTVNGTPLTARRIEILGYAGKGLQNAEIAALIGISTHGVETQMKSILRILGASNRTEAAVMAARQGWI